VTVLPVGHRARWVIAFVTPGLHEVAIGNGSGGRGTVLDSLEKDSREQNRGSEMFSRSRRLLGGIVLALAVLVSGLTAATPAQADPTSQLFNWRWGYYGTGSPCTMSISIGRYSVNGKVNLRGSFNGCSPRSGSDGLGVLTVISDAPVKRLGGSVGEAVCWTHNYCTKTVAIPFSGAKTYCGHATYSDDGYRRRHSIDPYLFACAHVDR
jgi:hypothetical protein